MGFWNKLRWWTTAEEKARIREAEEARIAQQEYDESLARIARSNEKIEEDRQKREQEQLKQALTPEEVLDKKPEKSSLQQRQELSTQELLEQILGRKLPKAPEQEQSHDHSQSHGRGMSR